MENNLIFVSEEDIWKVDLSGGVARRLTFNLSPMVKNPKISPNGKYIAFSASEEGYVEIYLIDINGANFKRVTYLGANSNVIGWSKDSKYIYFASNFAQAFDTSIYKISIDGGEPELMPFGYANELSTNGKSVVIGRHTRDTARWKRYRGGTAGEIWVDEKGEGDFKQILKGMANLVNPMWIGKRIYFVSDHEGIANIYSCTPKGNKITRHTNHNEFFVRNASTDGKTIVYHAGADIYKFDIKANKSQKVNIIYYSTQTQTRRKFIDAGKYLTGFDLSPDGTKIAITFRGKLTSFENWSGAVNQHGKKDGVRYKNPVWLYDKKTLVAVTDEYNGEDRLILIKDKKETILKKLDVGIVRAMLASPTEEKIAIINHRNELLLADCKKKSITLIDKSDYERIGSFDWAPDGNWIAYSFANTNHTRIIKVANINTKKSYEVTNTVFSDQSPVFSDDGKYLFFSGQREFYPVYDTMKFDMAFIKTDKLFAIPLKKDIKSPLIISPKPFSSDKEKNNQEKQKNNLKIEIDFEDIQKRLIPLPVKAGLYFNLYYYKNKLFYMDFERDCTKKREISEGNLKNTLKYFDFDRQTEEILIKDITSYKLSLQRSAMIVVKDDKLFVYKTGEKPNEKVKNKYSFEGGHINLKRIKVYYHPKEEWKQMYREAWLLQREHFWTPNMSGIDWQLVYKRYYPLLERVGSRSEFSDIIWEMQGELGTSHCYEYGGDYRKPELYPMGKLGCSYKLSKDGKYYVFDKIFYGDSSESHEISPLLAPGVNIKEGDMLLAINGTKTDKNTSPRELLLNLSNTFVTLTVKSKNDKKERDVTVKTLAFEGKLHYRHWVNKNKEYVHKKSNGKIGYVHIPNMMSWGFSEFYRNYLSETRFDALIVDVRYNGGGHVSPLILEKLARKTTGYDITRWSKAPQAYPENTIPGPIVAITNEFAGSDGDIFSHNFKLMKIGKLIGKRTWGGVIGINGQYSLVDGAVTTQPEYSFWFKDVGWNVENHGTDPDIEVDITPKDYVNSQDPQLDTAIRVKLEELEKNPIEKPKFDNKPNLSLPKLPN